MSRAQLLEQLYLDHRVVSDRTVDSHIKNVRRKFEELEIGSDPIRSIYGVGYKYEPDPDLEQVASSPVLLSGIEWHLVVRLTLDARR